METARASTPDGALLVDQARVLEMIVRGRPLPEVLAALCEIIEQQAGRTVRAAILLVDPAQHCLRVGAGPSLPDEYNTAVDGVPIDANLGMCAAAAALGDVVVTPDIASAPSWAPLRDVPLAHGLVAAWSMPIVSSTRTVLGTFGTYFTTAREPLPQERQLVGVLAQTAALAIERDRADRVLREQSERQRFLAELAAATQPLSEPQALMATTARMLAEHLGADRCAYAEVGDERVFDITGDYARGVPSIVGRWNVAAFGTECVRQMLAGEPYVVEDSENDPHVSAADLEAYRATTIRSVVCVPLHKEGRFTAAMAVHQTTMRRWTPAEIELVSIVVSRCWEALERARVTRTLRESEARYRAIVETTPECVKLVSADGTLIQMNQAGLRMLEVDSEQQAVGRCVYDVIAPEHRERFRELNERVCRGEGGTLQFDIIGVHGTRRSIETSAVPLASPSGGFVQLAVTRDVSARAAAEGALAESRARLDYAVRLSGVGFWYCDLPFDELIWDSKVKEHFFFPEDARITIDRFYDRIHPDDRETTREAVDASIRDHSSYDVIYRTVDPTTGSTKWLRALGGTAYAADGTPARFDGVTVDVTAQHLDQERLAQVAAAALTIHSATSLESVLRVVTEEARRIIGADRAVTLASGGDEHAAIRTESPPGASALDLSSVLGPSARPRRMTRADLARQGVPAEALPVRSWLAVPLVGRSGAVLGSLELFDTHGDELTAAEEAILVQLAQLAAVAVENVRLYDRLREQDRRKDEFLATLAHELRNPLAPIRTGLELLQLDVDREQTARTYAVMQRQLGHLVHMIDDLLDISRVTRGKIALKKQRVDLRTVLDSALEAARSLVEAGGHELAVRMPSEPLPLDVDPTRLSQVFANLVNNAAKYTPAGGRILIAAEREESSLVVRVSDTGVGIPADMLPQVFDMFTQVGRSIDRAQGGLGIGLTLVRRLVEMHGGRVEVESPGPGLGSTFTVRVPLAEQPHDSTCEGGTPVASGTKGLRILVVDDNRDAAETLAIVLAHHGHETRMAHTGPEALDAATVLEPHVVFLDIGLPGLNGYEVARELRARHWSTPPLLVALTGWGTDEDRRQAQAAGFDRHLVKPVDQAKIVNVLLDVRP